MDQSCLSAFLDALPKVQYLPEDFREIPGTQNRLVPRGISRKGLTAYVRKETRKGINVGCIGTLDKAEAKRSAQQYGLEPELMAERMRCAVLSQKFQELAEWFQKRLLEAEYPNGFPSREERLIS